MSADPAQDFTGKSILVHVPSPEDRELFERAAGDYAHSVLWSQSLEETFQLCSRHLLSAIVVPVNGLLPRAVGTLRRILQSHPGVPVLALVDDAERAASLEALRLGAFCVLRRPLHWEELAFGLGSAITSTAERFDPSLLVAEERRIVLPNDYALVTPVARSLVETTIPPHDPRRPHVLLGLVEILNNAIEHGNLAIDYAMKQEALRNSTFYRLAQERSARSPFRERIIAIESRVDPLRGKITYRVTDQGEGFDWRTLPDPRAETNLEARHGRGILLARHSFDHFAFNEKGNSVTMTLNLPPRESR